MRTGSEDARSAFRTAARACILPRQAREPNRSERAMSVENLHGLLKHELGDLLYAEKTILKGLKKMAKEAKDPTVRERLEQHYTETEGQITNLESAFEAIGEKAKAQKCPGILGIMEEKKEFDEEEAE